MDRYLVPLARELGGIGGTAPNCGRRPATNGTKDGVATQVLDNCKSPSKGIGRAATERFERISRTAAFPSIWCYGAQGGSLMTLRNLYILTSHLDLCSAARRDCGPRVRDLLGAEPPGNLPDRQQRAPRITGRLAAFLHSNDLLRWRAKARSRQRENTPSTRRRRHSACLLLWPRERPRRASTRPTASRRPQPCPRSSSCP